MDPLTERVFEDRFWFVILMAIISFVWFHHRDKRVVEPMEGSAREDSREQGSAGNPTISGKTSDTACAGRTVSATTQYCLHEEPINSSSRSDLR